MKRYFHFFFCPHVIYTYKRKPYILCPLWNFRVTYVSRILCCFLENLAFLVKVFSLFHCFQSFCSFFAPRLMSLFPFWHPLLCGWQLSFFKYVSVFGNFTFFDAYYLYCPSFFLFISFVPSYLQGLFCSLSYYICLFGLFITFKFLISLFFFMCL